MSVTDHYLLLKLMRHQYGTHLPDELFDQLYELICCLPDQQRSYDAELLQRFGGKELRSTLGRIGRCASETEQMQMRRELHRMLTDRLRTQAIKQGDLTIDVLLERTAACSEPQRQQQLIVWLFGRLEWYQKEFAKDEFIRPEKALRHQLIDRVEGR